MTGHEPGKPFMLDLQPTNMAGGPLREGHEANMPIDAPEVALPTVERNLEHREPAVHLFRVRYRLRQLVQVMDEALTNVLGELDVQLRLDPVAQRPISTDTIQAYAKI
jgi:hypothetical protein